MSNIITELELESLARNLAARFHKEPKHTGGGWTSHCPIHDDEHGSLSLNREDNKPLWCCQAGCDQDRLTDAIKKYLPKDGNKKSKVERLTDKIYQYHDAAGKLVLQKLRYIPKTFKVRRPDGNGGYIWKLRDVDKNIIYKLPEVLEAIKSGQTIYEAEGEKDCDNLAAFGLCATCNVFGASKDIQKPKWTDRHAAWLKGATEVVIFPDNDDAGRAHAQAVALSLHKIGVPCKVIELPGLPDKGDVSDWLGNGGTKEELLELVESVTYWQPTSGSADFSVYGSDKATSLLRLVERSPNVQIFRIPSGEVFATINDRTIPIDSMEFSGFLYKLYRAASGGELCGPEALNTVTAFLRGTVATCCPVYVRLAHHDRKVYVDLANQAQEIIEIAAGNWCVISVADCPVKFWQPPGMKALPRPIKGGDLGRLRQFMNIQTDEQYELVVLYLVGCFVDGPLLVLEIVGEKGSAKTTQARIIRLLIDPSECEVIVQPDSVRDLLLACRNQFLLILDNVGKFSAEQLDAHCCISTGASKRERRLYTNAEEAIYKFRRPQIITAIQDVIRRSDLNDRKKELLLHSIPKPKRRTENAIFTALEPEMPALLGALYDTIAGALKNLPEVKAANLHLPRMADTAEFLIAAERYLGWQSGTVSQLFDDEAASDAQDVLEADPFALTLIAQVKAVNNSWTATPSQTLKTLNNRRSGNPTGWPRSTKGLFNKLRELAPDLRQIGLTFEQEIGGDRNYTFTFTPPVSNTSAANAQVPKEAQDNAPKNGGLAADKFSEPPEDANGRSMADRVSQLLDNPPCPDTPQHDVCGESADPADKNITCAQEVEEQPIQNNLDLNIPAQEPLTSKSADINDGQDEELEVLII